MASFEEVLAAMSATNDYSFDDLQYIIDDDLRTISIPSGGVILGVITDKDVNRVNFKMKRFYNGFDMSDGFIIRVNYVNANGSANYYTIPDADKRVTDTDLMFTWLVGSDVVAYNGEVALAVAFIKQTGGVITQKFNSTIAYARVLDGLDVDSYVPPQEQEDILTHLQRELDEYSQEKIIEINASIPKDYHDTVARIDALETEVGEMSPVLDSLADDMPIVKEDIETLKAKETQLKLDLSKVSDSVDENVSIIQNTMSYEYASNVDPLYEKLIPNKTVSEWNVIDIRNISDSVNDYSFSVNANTNDTYRFDLWADLDGAENVEYLKIDKKWIGYKKTAGLFLSYIKFYDEYNSDGANVSYVKLTDKNKLHLIGTFKFNGDYGNANYAWNLVVIPYDSNGNLIRNVTLSNIHSAVRLQYYDNFTDKTLSKTNTPADAKTVGDCFKKAVNKVFYPVKKEYEIPFSNFTHRKTLINAYDLPASDWRNVYCGLGYDITYNYADNKYYMFYAAYNGTITQIGLMTSTDLENWEQYGNNPILSPTGISGDFDKGGCTFPQLLQLTDKWIMYYVGFDTVGFEKGVHTICYAESTDLINWTRKGKVLDKNAFIDSGFTNINVLYRPNVKNFFGKYYMFINAGVDDASIGGESEDIYVAVSDNPINGWKVIDKVIDAKILFPDSDYKICSDPCVICNGEEFIMAFWSNNGINFAISHKDEFPLRWHVTNQTAIGFRPLLIPNGDEMLLFENYADAKVLSVLSANII